MARTKVRIEIDEAGVQQFLQSAAVENDLATRGQRIATTANASIDDHGFTVERGTRGKTRSRVFVQTDSAAAALAEATNRALSKAIDAGR